jgi:methyl-accepting chemotaxis protein
VIRTLSLKYRALVIGAATGALGASIALATATWLGHELGAALGLVFASGLGAAGALTASRILEHAVWRYLSSTDSNQFGLPVAELDAVGAGELDGVFGMVRESLKRSRELEAQWQDVGAEAHAIWSAIHSKATNPPPTPETPACITSLLEMFRQTAHTLVRYASTLEDGNERMASGALDQTETVSRTTSTVEDLSDKIDRISQNAENATEACDRTRQEARRGLEQVHQVIEGMERLRAQIDINGRKARRLGDRSVEIGTIVELIRGISSRTDMLALNATIESVRAGEHGRGFAVVAEEIRKLSERTAAATRDIGTLVEAIQADTHESIRALGEEQNEMEKEAQRVREAGSALERISQVAEHSAHLVDGISKSTNDQVAAAQELVRAMQRISDVSHLTLERTTQSRESIRGLASWCERLAPLSATDLLIVKRDVAEPLFTSGSSLSTHSSRRKRRLVGSERTS